MMSRFVLTALGLAAPHLALAMSVAAAGENLLYFEHARLSSEHCEQRGIPTNPAYATWKSRNSSTYSQATETIKEEMVKRGLSKDEQEVVVAESSKNRVRLAREQIAKRGVDCARFDTVLQMYSTC